MTNTVSHSGTALNSANPFISKSVHSISGSSKFAGKLNKGDLISFGSYPQNNGDVKEPLEWKVLEVNGNEVFLVSRYGIDCRQYYHEQWAKITWEDSDLRKWLNDDFLKVAFSEEEQERILLSEVVNDNNPEEDTKGGNDTRDRLFILSVSEAEKYFESERERSCRPTALARYHGAWANIGRTCWWWLRSPGGHQDYVVNVGPEGELYLNGYHANSDFYAVRPAMRLNLGEITGTQDNDKAPEDPGTAGSTVSQEEQPAVPELKKGDRVKFGRYPYYDGKTMKPVEWLVLEADGDEAIFLSCYGLDFRQYYLNGKDVSWESCDLRRWLNEDFLKTAFSEAEQEWIVPSDVRDDPASDNSAPSGNSTRDQVFCLSASEAAQYLGSAMERQCLPTDLSKQKGASFGAFGHTWWWLRSPGENPAHVANIDPDGRFSLMSANVTSDFCAVRPALRIRLSQNTSAPESKLAGVITEDQAVSVKAAPEFNSKLEYYTFGSYPQNGDAREPLEWLVLKTEGDRALLLSRYGIDLRCYREDRGNALWSLWKNSDVREWLNGDFLKAAFSEEEQQRIMLTKLVNDRNECGIPKPNNVLTGKLADCFSDRSRAQEPAGIKNTQDRIFCLSIADTERYFKTPPERQCRITEHARKQVRNYNFGNGSEGWWLRCSPGKFGMNTLFVSCFGVAGNCSGNKMLAVRPALWVQL
ncbi:DUF6273 domain-containing protein [Succinimonas sp.]|uniref:DUF6273 domain-containing protein n=1 Tax=Succinimonas sp. TaxID=1936151 RepID=UPI00386C89F3